MSQAVFESLSEQQQQDLRTVCERLQKQNRSLNLVAPSTVDQMWERHILDSLQLVPMVEQALEGLEGPQSVLDIGTGGGLPAIPLAIAFAQSDNISVQALDSDRKKVDSIRLTTLGLTCRITLHSERVGDHRLQHAVVTSRALASLSKLLDWTTSVLKPGGKLIFLKGARHAEEVAEAKAEGWRFECQTFPSVTQAEAAVLVLSDISRNPTHE